LALMAAKELASFACAPSDATETRWVEGVQPDAAPRKYPHEDIGHAVGIAIDQIGGGGNESHIASIRADRGRDAISNRRDYC